MKRDTLMDAFRYIDDSYLTLAENYAAPKGDKKMLLKSNVKPKNGKLRRTVVLAAVLTALLAVSVFAISFFTMRGREAYDGESYRIFWEESETSYHTWTDLKYILKFEGPEECPGAEFKEGWLPFEPSAERNAWACSEDGWRTDLVSECAPEVDSASENYQPYRVELFYAPQFLNGGALLLLNQTPGEITEEQWGEEKVLKFTASQHHDAVDVEELDLHIPEKDMYYYFVIRFHPGRGYILVTSGTSDMETVEHVAREVQIRQTGETIRSGDFINNCTFIDVGQG